MPRLGHAKPRIASRRHGAVTAFDVRENYAYDDGTAREAQVAAQVAATRERARAGLHRDQEALATVIADRRCDSCGYLTTWCPCPGGPRGGAT